MAKKEAMSVVVEGDMLVVRIPMQTPSPVASGKTLVVATTHGNQPTEAVVNGKPVILGLNAYIRNK
jgi:hypothetical protein